MICPEKSCKAEIPDDSLFCDQCGIQLLRCQKCNSVGLRKCCGKCGGVMVFTRNDNTQIPDNLSSVTYETKTDDNQETINSKDKNYTSIQESPEQLDSTKIIPLNLERTSLELFHNDGWKLIAKDGNTLGREFGEFVSHLGVFPVISARHAKVSYKDDKWYIIDLHSTNKTYINNTRLIPDNPTEIKNDDMLVLANIQFTAKIT